MFGVCWLGGFATWLVALRLNLLVWFVCLIWVLIVLVWLAGYEFTYLVLLGLVVFLGLWFTGVLLCVWYLMAGCWRFALVCACF